MPVDEREGAWARFQPERERVTKIAAGRDEAVALVRKMPGWDAQTLACIQEAAYFLPMVSRTLEMFGGLVFLKSPSRTFPEGLTAYTDDVTQTGQEIDRLAEATFDAVLKTSAAGVLVDYPAAPQGLTKADAEKKGYRPSLRLYDADSILTARLTKVDGAMRLSHVRLLEEYQEAGADEFTLVCNPQVRVLDLIDGVYQQRVFRKESAGWAVVETIVPLKDGAPLSMIPMFFSNTRDGEARCEKPPMTDLADINIGHLNNSAQAEWAYAWLGAPMLFGAGFELAEGDTIQIGSSQAVVVKDPNAKLSIVQAGADAVGALKQAMDDKRRDAATLGARMLMESPKAAIAAETARIERAGEVSVIGAVANAVSQCLTNALRFLAQWAGVPDTVTGKDGTVRPILYWLNTDVLPTRMNPQELTALLDAWQRGALSKRELFARFQEAEVVDPALSFEDHEEQIASEEAEASEDDELAAGDAPLADGPDTQQRAGDE